MAADNLPGVALEVELDYKKALTQLGEFQGRAAAQLSSQLGNLGPATKALTDISKRLDEQVASANAVAVELSKLGDKHTEVAAKADKAYLRGSRMMQLRTMELAKMAQFETQTNTDILFGYAQREAAAKALAAAEKMAASQAVERGKAQQVMYRALAQEEAKRATGRQSAQRIMEIEMERRAQRQLDVDILFGYAQREAARKAEIASAKAEAAAKALAAKEAARAAAVAPAGPSATSLVAAAARKNALAEETAEALRTRDAYNQMHSAARGVAGGTGAPLWLTYGSTATIAFTAALAGTAAMSIKLGATFADNMAIVKQLSKDTAGSLGELDAQMVSLNQNLLGMAKNSRFSAIEISEGMRIIAQAGFNAADGAKLLPAAMDLAVASGGTLEQAATAIAGSLAAFNLEASESGRVANVIALASDKSQTNIAAMSESMKQASSVAQDYNLSLEESGAFLAILAQRNITGSAAGTALRNMMIDLSGRTKKASEALEQMGISLYDTQGRARNTSDVLTDLFSKMDSLSDEARNKFLKTFGDERGIRQIAALYAEGVTNVDSLVTAMRRAGDNAGYAARRAEELNSTTLAEFQKAANTLTSTLIEGFLESEDSVKAFAKELQAAAGSDGFRELVSGVTETTAAILSGLVAAGPYLVTLTKLAALYGTAKLAVAGFNLAMGAVASVQAMTAAIGLQSTAVGAYSVVATRATVVNYGMAGSFRALWAAAGPLTIALAGVTAAYLALSDGGDTAAEGVAKMVKSMDTARFAGADPAKYDEVKKTYDATLDWMLGSSGRFHTQEARNLDEAIKNRTTQMEALAAVEESMRQDSTFDAVAKEQYLLDRRGQINTQTLQDYIRLWDGTKEGREKLLAHAEDIFDQEADAHGRAMRLMVIRSGEAADQLIKDAAAAESGWDRFWRRFDVFTSTAPGRLGSNSRSNAVAASDTEVAMYAAANAVDSATESLVKYNKEGLIETNAAAKLQALVIAASKATGQNDQMRESVQRANRALAEQSKLVDQRASKKLATLNASLDKPGTGGFKPPGREDNEAARAAQREAERAQREIDNRIKGYEREADAIEKAADALRYKNEFEGFTESALYKLKSAEAREAADKVVMSGGTNLSKEDQAKADALDRQAGAYARMAEYSRTLENNQNQQRLLALIKDSDKTWGLLESSVSGIADAFGRMGAALTGVLVGFDNMMAKQEELAKQRADLLQLDDSYPLKQKALQKNAEESAKAQVKAYGNMAASAKGFFKENSKGYKTMEFAEKAFRAAELAGALESFITRTGLVEAFTSLFVLGKQTETAATVASVGPDVAASMAKGQAAAVAGVAGQATGDPYTAFARMAAMAAAMAALGFAVSSKGGSVNFAEQRQAAAGAGSILGDAAAKSESISKSLEILEGLGDEGLTIQTGMLISLRNIESSMSGLARLTIQSGITTGSYALGGVQTGSTVSALGKGLQFMNNPNGVLGTLAKITSNIPILGDITGFIGGLANKIGSFIGKGFGSTTSVEDFGIKSGVQTLGDIQDRGFAGAAYTTTKTKKKTAWVTTSTSYREQLAGLPSELTNQFSLVLDSLASGVTEAADIMGMGGQAFEDKLKKFAVNIGYVSFKGLSGEQIQKQFENIFSKVGDDLARYMMPGIEQFQKVGEGAFETLTRLVGVFATTDQLLLAFGKTAKQVFGAEGFASAAVRQRLIDLAGTAEDFSASLGSYLQNYYSDAERAAMQQKQMESAFKGLGLAVPKTREEFRKLVEAQDLTTQGGAETYTALMQLQEVFAALSETATESVSEMIAAGKDLREYLNSLKYGELSSLTTQQQYAEALKDYEKTLAAAKGGDMEAVGMLQSRSDQLLSLGREMFASSPEYAALRDKILRELDPLAAKLEAGDLTISDSVIEQRRANELNQAILDQAKQTNARLEDQIRQNAAAQSETSKLTNKLIEGFDRLMRGLSNKNNRSEIA